MRAVIVPEYGGPEVLTEEQFPDPEPQANEVRIDVRSMGINFADIDMRRGQYPNAPSPPFIPGLELAGVIEKVGEQVDREVGEQIGAIMRTPEGQEKRWGGYATTVALEEEWLIEIPPTLPIENAAAYPIRFLTAHNALYEWGGLSDGETVLIQAAAGGVGTAAVQLAATRDVEIVATASTPGKLSLAEDLGADYCINYSEQNIAEEVGRVTHGAGVDLVLDGVGGDAFYAALESLAGGGRIVSYGVASGRVPTVAAPRLFVENKSIYGYHLGHALRNMEDKVFEATPPLLELFGKGRLDLLIDTKFPLGEATSAHEYIERRDHKGKIILTPD